MTRESRPVPAPDQNFDRPPRGSAVDRRTFLGHLGIGAGAAVGLAASTPRLLAAEAAKDPGAVEGLVPVRQAQAFQVRMRAADLARERQHIEQTANGDEDRYPNRIGNYSKGFPHNNLGEVEPAAYNAFLAALATADPADFESLPMGLGRKLTNPLSGMAFDLEGPDSHHLAQAPAPRIASPEAASDLGEVYWMALCRDIHFSEYDSSPLVASAAADLSRFSDFRGPRSGFTVTSGTLFRGNTTGDLVGPYLSQFLWADIPMGALRISQRIWTLLPGQDYLTSYSDWLASQNGGADSGYPIDSTARYIRNLRDLGQWVHVDALYQAYHQACLILLAGALILGLSLFIGVILPLVLLPFVFVPKGGAARLPRRSSPPPVRRPCLCRCRRRFRRRPPPWNRTDTQRARGSAGRRRPWQTGRNDKERRQHILEAAEGVAVRRPAAGAKSAASLPSTR